MTANYSKESAELAAVEEVFCYFRNLPAHFQRLHRKRHFHARCTGRDGGIRNQ